ncbi:hypothetical protein IT571_00090 [Candidatus Sumerlaeota bacterium]|nr:hypothetical protein [Candidatus Sumerlaeota bacterium]HNM45866.1 hypothetical protein [Candidatus Sumerlaeota bacterium]
MSFPTEPIKPPTPEEQREMDSLHRHFGGGENGLQKIYAVVESQHGIVHQRAQSLIQLAGVVVTVTGFSGRIIADTNLTAQILIVVGLSLVVLAAGIALLRVMPIKWMSSYMHLDERDWLVTALRRRELKSRAFALASVILMIGMICYVSSISIMLMNPWAAELQKVR